MIYTVIADYKKLLPEIILEEGGVASPFSLLPAELQNYIRTPKNEESRLSRLGGYLLLFHTVRFLFGEFDFEIGFNESGKPHFTSEKMKDIFFNISHSEGLCAVTVSEDNMPVGVDIQAEADKEREKKLSERFEKLLSKDGQIITPEKGKKTEPMYLFGGFSAYGDCMFAEIPISSLKQGHTERDLTDRWAFAEAVMKCDGRGFGAVSELEKIVKDTKTETVKFTYKGKSFSVCTAETEASTTQSSI